VKRSVCQRERKKREREVVIYNLVSEKFLLRSLLFHQNTVRNSKNKAQNNRSGSDLEKKTFFQKRLALLNY